VKLAYSSDNEKRAESSLKMLYMLTERGFFSHSYQLKLSLFIRIMRCIGHVFIVRKKTPLDSLRKHFIHRGKQLHKIVIKKKSDSKYTAYNAQSTALHENKLLY